MTIRQPGPRETTGDAWDILGSYRRRLVLALVSERADAIERAALARRVAEIERERPADDITRDELRSTEIRLHHVDLPRLAAAGLVHYDPDHGGVESDDLPLEGAEWLEMPVVEALRAWNGYR